ncbi:hypothetical protein KSS87_020821 [Heliosperma pusillum]|nr:hypothetical protein KSS87_020821 [Heliosperma pusillum]
MSLPCFITHCLHCQSVTTRKMPIFLVKIFTNTFQ